MIKSAKDEITYISQAIVHRKRHVVFQGPPALSGTEAEGRAHRDEMGASATWFGSAETGRFCAGNNCERALGKAWEPSLKERVSEAGAFPKSGTCAGNAEYAAPVEHAEKVAFETISGCARVFSLIADERT